MAGRDALPIFFSWRGARPMLEEGAVEMKGSWTVVHDRLLPESPENV